mmetsp:Transcript_2545/g.4268  ORF Transcript_2545/g.4268 Transcript_2545/m.4268 type:complete len:160 (-) Transcript_2545:63-542(-)
MMALDNMIQEEQLIETVQVENGEIAVEEFTQGFNRPCGCSNRTFRLILMDIQMPIMNGLQASRLIMRLMRQSGEHGRVSPEEMKENGLNEDRDLTHIIALTSYTHMAPECIEIGLKECENKPLNADRLYEVIQRHFYRYPEEQVLRNVERRLQEKKKAK